MTKETKILVIEDDPEVVSFLNTTVTGLGYHFDFAREGISGLEKARSGNYDLAIVDVNLPGMSGFEICKQVRMTDTRLPILMLTSRSDEIDRVLGLEFGADDYVVKPGGVRELEARIKALLRRAQLSGIKMQAPETAKMTFGDLQLDLGRMTVTLKGAPVHLSPLEFELLVFLASNPGQIITREQIMDRLWGYGGEGIDLTLTKHLSRIRSKLEADPANPRYLKTVRGVGYRFAGLDEL